MWGPTGIKRSSPIAEYFERAATGDGQMGFRVPAVVLSPYAKAGKVVHTQFGHESILRMVEDRYRLRPLTVRDAKANSIAAAFDFAQKPREPPDLPTPPSIISQPCGAASVPRP